MQHYHTLNNHNQFKVHHHNNDFEDGSGVFFVKKLIFFLSTKFFRLHGSDVKISAENQHATAPIMSILSFSSTLTLRNTEDIPFRSSLAVKLRGDRDG